MLKFGCLLRALVASLPLDPRALAVLRVGLALLLLTDLGFRALDFEAHYTSAGVLPPELYVDRFKNPYWWSLHLMLPDHLLWTLFGTTGLASVALLLGFHTRLATILAWGLTVSLHSANPLVAQAGDTAIRQLLFWGMFLPLGGVWSLDSSRQGRDPVEPVATAAGFAVVVQLMVVYAFTAAHKLSNSVWRDGEAIYYALGHEAFTTELGAWLAEFPKLLSFATWVTPFVQLLVTIVVPMTWTKSWVRSVAALIMIGMHISFMLFLHLGSFSFVMIVWWLLLLPREVWDRLCRVPRVRVHAAVERAFGERRQWLSWLALLTLTYGVYWNFRNTPLAMPRSLEIPGRVLRLEQNWQMFSNPPRSVVWITAQGQRADGSFVELLPRQGGPAFDANGKLVEGASALSSVQYPTQRWRKYFSNIASSRYRRHRRLYAEYLCRRHNVEDPSAERIDRVRVLAYEYDVPPPHSGVSSEDERRYQRQRWASVRCKGLVEPSP